MNPNENPSNTKNKRFRKDNCMRKIKTYLLNY